MLFARLLRWCFFGEALLNLGIALVAVFAPPVFVAQFTSQMTTPAAVFFVQSWGACLVGLALMEGGVLLRKDDALLAKGLFILLIGDFLYVSGAVIFGLASHTWPGAVVGSLVVTGTLVVLRLAWLFRYEQRKLVTSA